MAVSFIENGQRVPSVATYARLAAALSLTPSDGLAQAENKDETWSQSVAKMNEAGTTKPNKG